MTRHNRIGRINVRLLILLGLVFSVAATGLVIVHTMRKRMIAQRALVSAKAAFAAGEWETAGREYRAYLSKFGDDMDAMMQFAQAELSIRPPRPDTIGSAINAYRKVLRTKPGDKDLCERLARLYFNVGDYTNVRYVVSQRLSVDPHDVTAMVWMGRAMLAQHQHDDIERELGHFVDEKDPTAVPVYVLLAESAIARGDAHGPEKALDALDKAVRNSPTSAEAHARRAHVFLLSGGTKDSKRAERARSDLEAADALKPEDAAVRLLLADVWLEMNEPVRSQAEVAAAQKLPLAPDALYDFEREQAKLGFLQTSSRLALIALDKQQALALADKGMKELTADRRMQFLPMAAQLYVAAGKVDLARELLKEFHAAVDEPARGNKRLTEQLALLDAQLSNAQSRPYEALSRLQEIVSAHDVEDATIWREIGYGYMRTNQDRRALDALEKYVSTKRDDYAALVMLARVYYRNQDWSKTLKYAELALERNLPDDVDARLLRIDAILKGAKGVKPSDTEIERYASELHNLRQNPKYAKRVEIRLIEAQIANLQKGPDAAAEVLRQASRECDAPLPATLQLIDLLRAQGKRDDAVSACQEAIKQAPDAAQPRTVLAALQYEAGQKEQARKTLEEAAAALKGEEGTIAQLTLGAHLLTIGDREKAPADREKGLALLRKLAADYPEDIRPRLQLLDQPEVQKATQPDHNEPQMLVEQIKKIEGERGIRHHYEQARVLMRQPNWKPQQDQIIDELTKAVEGDKAWPAAVLLLGGVYEALAKDAQAEELYRRFVDNYPDNTTIVARYLELLERQGRYMQASQVLERLPNAKNLASHKTNIDIYQRHYEEAIKDLQTQTEKNPKDAASRVLLARLIWQQTKDAAKALSILDEAQKLAPDLLSTISTRVVILNAAGRKDEAIQVLNAEVQRRNDFSAYLLRAEYYASEGKLAEAESDYQHLTTFPTSVKEGYLRLGMFFERTQHPEKAVVAYESGLKTDSTDQELKRSLTRALLTSASPDDNKRGESLLADLVKASGQDPEVKMIQAGWLLKQGTLESRQKAMVLFDEVVQSNPRIIRAHIELIKFASAQGDLPKASQLAARGLGANADSPELLLISASLESDQENYVRARELVHSVLQRDPDNLVAMNLMTQLCIQLNDLKEAETQNNAVLQKHPDDETARLSQVKIVQKTGTPSDAINLLEKFHQTPRGKVSAQGGLLLADLYRQEKQYEKCEQVLSEVEKAVPEMFNVFAIRLQSLAEQQKFEDFFKLLKTRLASYPKDSQAINAAATILSGVNASAELDRAKPLFQSFIAQNPGDITAELAMAMLSYRTLDMKGAQEAYLAALRIDPFNVKALNNLAWIMSEELGDSEHALNYANTAVLRFPTDPLLLNTRGVIFFHLNKLPQAKQDLQKCLEMPGILPGTRARTKAFLARIALRAEDAREARSLFEEALQIDQKSKVLTPQERADIEKMIGAPASHPTTR